MSMNLNLKDGADSVHLFQTPTEVTYALLDYDETGKPRGGHEAVRDRYLSWLEQDFVLERDGDEEDKQWAREVYDEHRERILAVRDPFFSVE